MTWKPQDNVSWITIGVIKAACSSFAFSENDNFIHTSVLAWRKSNIAISLTICFVLMILLREDSDSFQWYHESSFGLGFLELLWCFLNNINEYLNQHFSILYSVCSYINFFSETFEVFSFSFTSTAVTSFALDSFISHEGFRCIPECRTCCCSQSSRF